MEPYNSIIVTATGQVKTGSGYVIGVTVSSHTAGTLKLWDNTSAAGTVLVDTYTFTAGSSVVTFPAPYAFATGLFATVGGTVALSLAVK